MRKIIISKSIINDHITLTELTIRSKSYWKYSAEQMAEWKDDLTISKKYISDNFVYNLILDYQIIGYYSFFELNKTTVKLDNLFIEPTYIGKGFGRLLLEDFEQRIYNLGFKTMQLDADPNAEKFYLKFGFKIIGKIPTAIKNRFLLIMEK